jgi:hypothetical protein
MLISHPPATSVPASNETSIATAMQCPWLEEMGHCRHAIVDPKYRWTLNPLINALGLY